MAGFGGYSREAVRVKVKKCEGSLPIECRKFSVDPQITSMEVLQSILSKAFDLKSDFSISYKTIDPNGQDVYLAVLSDWDLDAAFLRAHNISIASAIEPCLNLQIDIKPFSEAPDWDVANSLGSINELSPFQQSIDAGQKYVQNMQNKLPGLIINQVERTLSMVTKALNFVDEQNIQPPRPPLSDIEFRGFLDSVGQIVQPHDLRNVIYLGGIDPSLRRVAWKHLLNVYPDGMTGRDRMDYMKRKAIEYYKLRDTWKCVLQKDNFTGELGYVTSMVRKDVLRTDRLHPFYAGNDDNKNIASLFNILTTYALNHPAVSYCQGMSDIASPLLVTMTDEAQAYICFCALMTRLYTNFMLDGIAMTRKFAHLSEALQHYDPEFYKYLKLQQADDLLFCYRWLLLEMKREFAFDDSLRMLEVLWSALPASPPEYELALFEREFVPQQIENSPPKSPSINIRTPRENAYTKICELRRQSSAQSLSMPTQSMRILSPNSLIESKRRNLSLDECTSVDCLHDAVKAYQSLEDNIPMVEDGSNIVSIENSENVFQEIRNAAIPQLDTSISDHKINNVENTKQTDDDDARQTHSIKRLTNTNNINIFSRQFSQNRKGHFKDLKDRIAAGKKGLLSSLDIDENTDRKSKGQKVVKNFNEFLNFASINKSRISDKLQTIANSEKQSKPLIKLSKTNGDDIEETTVNVSNYAEDNLNLPIKSTDLRVAQNIDGNSPDDSEYFPLNTSMTRELRIELENLDRHLFGNNYQQNNLVTPTDYEENCPKITEQFDKNPSIAQLTDFKYSPLSQNSMDNGDDEDNRTISKSVRNNGTKDIRQFYSSNANIDVFVWENPLHQISPSESSNLVNRPTLNKSTLEMENNTNERNIHSLNAIDKKRINSRSNSIESDNSSHMKNVNTLSPFEPDMMTASIEEAAEANIALTKIAGSLPPPSEFGDGNPFLMFLCLTLLLQHRNYIVKSQMDYNEMAMHFDKMVRKHNVHRVLHQARRMYSEYLKMQNNLRTVNKNDKKTVKGEIRT